MTTSQGGIVRHPFVDYMHATPKGRAALGFFFSGLLIFALGILVSLASLSAMADIQQEREAYLASKIDRAPVGKTIQLRGKGFFVTSSKGLVNDEAFGGSK